MKVTQSAVRVITLAALLAKFGITSAQECVNYGFVLEFDGQCNYDNVFSAFADQVYFAVGGALSSCAGSVEDAKAAFDAKLDDAGLDIDGLCMLVYESTPKTPFTDAANKGDDLLFEKHFFNGRTEWQEEVETLYESEDGTFTSRLRVDAEAVKNFYDGVAEAAHVSWPGSLTNFQSSVTDEVGNPTCETNAAMCCWPKDRQANDNNGNCNKPYDVNCIDKDPADNTNLCSVDMSRGNLSNEFDSTGYGVFPGDNNNGEGAIHCHGLAWSNDAYDATARYKGNNLFYVSMYDHMHQRGYVENIPGAPMCACVEQMPTVSRSDCTQVDLTESVRITYDSSSMTFAGEVTSIEVDFNACQGIQNRNNDLWAYMARLYYQGDVTPEQFGQLGRTITDNGCDVAVEYDHQLRGLTRGYHHDETMWTKVAARDSLYEGPEWGKEAFNAALFEHSIEPIVLRVCATCIETHQYIYYKRLSDINDPDFDLLHNLIYQNNNGNGDNVWNEDFTLHSTYEDAVNDANPWQCLNDNYEYGAHFPGNCSPDGTRVTGQATRFTFTYGTNTGGKSDVGFYVNKPEDFAISSFDAATHTRSSLQTDLDIGDPKTEGRTFENDGTFYISAAGKDIWGKHDQFRYLSYQASGDIQVDVHVSSFALIAHGWAKCGIMLRGDNDPDSQYAFALLSGNQGAAFQMRRSKGMDATTERSVDNQWQDYSYQGSAYLRIIKAKDVIEMWKSQDGVDYVLHGTTIVLFPEDTFRVGLAVTSHHETVLSEATFEGFSVNTYEYPTAAPSISSAPTVWEPAVDIGDVNREGYVYPEDANGMTRILGGGSGIWGHHDEFFYYSIQRPSSDDFTVSMLMDYCSSVSQFSLGGLMIRDNNDEGAPQATIGVSGWGQGVAFQARTTADALTELFLQNYVPNSKVYLKLVKSGNDVTAFYKHFDAAEWTDAGTVTLALTGGSVQVGIAATAGVEKGTSSSRVDLRVKEYEVIDTV